MQVEIVSPNLQFVSAEVISHNEVYKFGGSSLKDSKAIRQAVELVKEAKSTNTEGLAVVVSANGKNTDLLIDLCGLPINEQDAALEHLFSTQMTRAKALLDTESLHKYQASLAHDIEAIRIRLTALSNTHTPKPETLKSEIIAFGEIWSAKLFAEAIGQAIAIDTREFLTFNQTGYCESTSVAKFNKLKAKALTNFETSPLFIFTGFIASDYQGNTLLLGRNGSDYSASLIGTLLGAKKVTFWTDVNGVFTADPNKVANAKHIQSLSFDNAMTLSQLGSPVLHHRTLTPLLNNHIELAIRCPSKAKEVGTVISQQASPNHHAQWVVNVQNDLYLIPLSLLPESCPVIVHFDCEQSQQTMALINREYLSQVDTCQYNRAKLVSIIGRHNKEDEKAFSQFFKNITRPLERPSQILTMPNALVAVFSLTKDKMREQNSTESERDTQLLEAQLHDYMMSQVADLTVGLIGPGQVGRQVLEILDSLNNKNKQSHGNARALKIDLALIANSTAMITIDGKAPVNTEEILATLATKDANKELLEPVDLDAFSSRLKALSTAHQNNSQTVIIDTTASEMVAGKYEQFFVDGHSIVTANKVAGASDSSFYQRLKSLESSNKWLYEATVGAGLPLLSSIQNLIRSGDTIHQIHAVCSGSLSWIFQQCAKGTSYSDAILQARSLGLTEPDPRIDLSGVDIARKVIILMRESWAEQLCDLTFNVSDIKLPKWLPQDVIETEGFDWGCTKNHAKLDAYFDKYIAKKPTDSLVPIVKIDLDALRGLDNSNNASAVSIELQSPDVHSEFFGLNPNDNIFIIYSDYYQSQPLIIRGPGAGNKVTAAGVVNDVLTLLK